MYIQDMDNFMHNITYIQDMDNFMHNITSRIWNLAYQYLTRYDPALLNLHLGQVISIFC